MCGCRKTTSSRRNLSAASVPNKIVSNFITRNNILQKNINSQQGSPLPVNQNKLNKNGEIIRKALLEKNKNKNKKYFK